MRAPATTAALVREASAPYWETDLFGYFRARGKLRGDPAFAAILAGGLLTGAQRILDLGCGQGLLAAWLTAARSRNDERPHLWPPEWPAPPRPISFRGIELLRRDVWRARVALGSHAEFEVGDIANAEFGSADAIVILDVLHYLNYERQVRVLERARAALPSEGGILLLRVSDANGGLRFSSGKYLDCVVMMAHYRRLPRVYCRSVVQWQELLTVVGFHSETLPMSAGTPFANTLLISRPDKRTRPGRNMTDTLITQ